MTRKDFEAIAKALGQSLSQGVSVNQANEIAAKFAANIAHTNPRFDRNRFIDAVLNAWTDTLNPDRPYQF